MSQSVDKCPHPGRHERAGWENGPYPNLQRFDVSEDDPRQFSALDLLVDGDGLGDRSGGGELSFPRTAFS